MTGNILPYHVFSKKFCYKKKAANILKFVIAITVFDKVTYYLQIRCCHSLCIIKVVRSPGLCTGSANNTHILL